MIRAGLISILIACGAIAGCDRGFGDGPPKVRWGQDECAGCGMILSDQRCAAALIVQTGRGRDSLLFDDIGDMVEYEKSKPELKVVRRWASDFETHGWLDASKAVYVKSDKVQTPMGSGIVAFTDNAHADAKRDEVGGDVHDFAGLAPH